MSITHGSLVAETLNKDAEFRRDWERLAPARKLAAELVRYRDKNGLSQKRLGEKLGVSQPRVARLESGEHNPELDTIAHIVDVTGIEFCVDFVPQGQKSKLTTKLAQAQAPSRVARDGVAVIPACA